MTTMDNNSIVPPPYIPKHYAVFRCKVDNRMYKWPIIMWCIFDVIIFIAAPTILWGLFAVLWSVAPLLAVVLLARYIWGNVTYVIDDNVLRISTPMKYCRRRWIFSSCTKLEAIRLFIRQVAIHSASLTSLFLPGSCLMK